MAIYVNLIVHVCIADVHSALHTFYDQYTVGSLWYCLLSQICLIIWEEVRGSLAPLMHCV